MSPNKAVHFTAAPGCKEHRVVSIPFHPQPALAAYGTAHPYDFVIHFLHAFGKVNISEVNIRAEPWLSPLATGTAGMLLLCLGLLLSSSSFNYHLNSFKQGCTLTSACVTSSTEEPVKAVLIKPTQ